MRFNIPKNDSKYHWTQHSVRKMMFYGLTADRVKRVIRNPKRIENGVAENTVAAMASSSNKKKPSEVWVMYATPKARSQKSEVKSQNSKFNPPAGGQNSKFIVISAWRYPGISPVGKQIPIPADILAELNEDGIIE